MNRLLLRKHAGANLAEAACLADGLVAEAADLTRVSVGCAEPALDARPMHEAERSSALARRQQSLADTRLVADTTDWTARHTANVNSDYRRAHAGRYHAHPVYGVVIWRMLMTCSGAVTVEALTFV